MWAFSSCSEQEMLFDAVLGLLIVGASLVVEHGLGKQATVVVARGLSCPEACGIFPNQGSNPCPLHWQVDSYPPDHQGSPRSELIVIIHLFYLFYSWLWALYGGIGSHCHLYFGSTHID